VVNITVSNVNHAPVANAGPAQNVAGGTVVTLSGSGTDVDGDAMTYAWLQTAGAAVTLSDATITNPTFTAPAATATDQVFTFELTVSDAVMGSVPSAVTITVPALGACNPADNTTCGAGSVVNPDAAAKVTFNNVNGSGNTADAPNNAAPAGVPAVPSQYVLAATPVYHEITTTATFTGTAEVCLSYNPADYNSEDNLYLLHYNGTKWEDITKTRRKLIDQICGLTSSFSPFIVGELPSTVWISLDWFSADSDGQMVNLGWETAGEIDNEGFNIFRAEAGGSYEAINARLIPARGLQPDGAIYHLIDDAVTPGSEYAYLLEDVDRFGVKTQHGPLDILVVDGAQNVYTEPKQGQGSRVVVEQANLTQQPFYGGAGGGCSATNAPTTWGDATGTLLLMLIPLGVLMLRNRRKKAA